MFLLKKISGLFILLLLITACSPKELNQEKVFEEEKSDKEVWIEEQLSKMTLEEKIGQMLIVSDYSTSVDEELKNKLIELKPGGFILFKENFESYEQTEKLINDINSTAEIPMFISIDQEGGRVQRLKELSDQKITAIPSMYQLGLTNDTELATDIGRVVGEELRVFNINLDFAPVLDILSNPDNTAIKDRSFGTTSEQVSKMALSFSHGLTSTGIIPVYKHFPGHGDTLKDSHDELPVITKTKEELMELEFKPFIDAINDGAQMIMVGHLAIPKIVGNNTPASLSRIIVTELLKEELGFDGLVITDALNMEALTENYTEEEIYIKAINAGVDILLMPNFDQRTIEIIAHAVQNQQISEEKIDDSVRKILGLKYDNLFIDNNYTREYLGSLEHQEIIQKVLDNS